VAAEETVAIFTPFLRVPEIATTFIEIPRKAYIKGSDRNGNAVTRYFNIMNSSIAMSKIPASSRLTRNGDTR
jgi:hypothetical protein